MKAHTKHAREAVASEESRICNLFEFRYKTSASRTHNNNSVEIVRFAMRPNDSSARPHPHSPAEAPKID